MAKVRAMLAASKNIQTSASWELLELTIKKLCENNN